MDQNFEKMYKLLNKSELKFLKVNKEEIYNFFR